MTESCRYCNHSGYLGKHCALEHITTYIDGCDRCGKMVDAEAYYNEKECPDFVRTTHLQDIW